jgi:putative restriction endonuclease
MHNTDYYFRAFASLKRGISAKYKERPATKGRAPHKPILLLSVLDLAAEGELPTNLIELTPALGELFNIYWSLVMSPDDHTTIAMPFFHLSSEGFWHLLPRPGQRSFIGQTRLSPSVGQLQQEILGARLDDELYALVVNPQTRDALRRVLIEAHFAPAVHERLFAQSVLNVEAAHYGDELLERARKVVKDELTGYDVPAAPVRDQGFRRAIVRAYDHRCAFCGVRIVTADGHSAIEAAHIIPWSESRDDRIGNGMALCRLCHWTFDEGLATVATGYDIRLSPQLTAFDNVAGHLATVAGRPLIRPAEQPLWPAPDNLRWHQKNRSRAR